VLGHLDFPLDKKYAVTAAARGELAPRVLGGENGFVAVLKVFMDETGIHDDSTVVAVAAYVSRPKHWRVWTKKWNRAKRPIRIFHAADCANFHGEFDGWDADRRDKVVANLLPVIPAHELAGIVIGIRLDDFSDALKGRDELIEMFGTPYTACFQWALTIIMEIATGHGRGERMAFVHEVNDFKGEALKAFEYVKQFHNPRGIPITLAFGSKADYPPLQAADVLAYEGGKFVKNPSGTLRRAWTVLDPDKTRIIARRYAKDNMPRLISDLTTFRQKLLDSGWDGKVI
jgi:hypothetical protein